MNTALFNSSLPHRLLVAVSRAHLAGGPPLDWQECATVATVSARQANITHALFQLANDGLIEAVLTPDGWTSLKPTARGLSRAGRAARPEFHDGDTPGHPARPVPYVYRSGSERVSATIEEISAELGTLSRYAAVAWLRTRQATTPRLTAMRTSMTNAWHIFTTFP